MPGAHQVKQLGWITLRRIGAWQGVGGLRVKAAIGGVRDDPASLIGKDPGDLGVVAVIAQPSPDQRHALFAIDMLARFNAAYPHRIAAGRRQRVQPCTPRRVGGGLHNRYQRRCTERRARLEIAESMGLQEPAGAEL